MKKIRNTACFVHTYLEAFWKEIVIIILFLGFILFLNSLLTSQGDVAQSFIIGLLASVLASVYFRIVDKINTDRKALTRFYTMANEILRCARSLGKRDSTSGIIILRIWQLRSEMSLLIDDMLTADDRKKAPKLLSLIDKILCQISFDQQAENYIGPILMGGFEASIENLYTAINDFQK